MIILHSRHDKASREFVANAPEGAVVFDFYNDTERAQWLESGGNMGLSAFPSVVLRHDTFTDTIDGEDVTTEAGFEIFRLPGDEGEPLPEIDTPLPDVGEPVAVGLYAYNGGYVLCRQAHTRMAFTPEETPALFSVWRPDSEDMIWIPNEPVSVGDKRIYNGTEYECIQSHTTQVDWRPDITPALWTLVAPPTAEWAYPVAYTIGDIVTYGGLLYECRQSHTSQAAWTPPAVLALWLPL